MDEQKTLELVKSYLELCKKNQEEGNKEIFEEYLYKAFRLNQELYEYYWDMRSKYMNLGQEEKANEYLKKAFKINEEFSECGVQIIANTKTEEDKS